MKNNCCYLFYIEQSEQISETVFNDFLQQVSLDFQKEIAAYKHWQSAQNSLLGKIILLFALKKLGLSFSLNDLKIGKKDRPFLYATFDFNIYHSVNIIAVALIKYAKFVVDVEKHRSINLPLFKKYFDKDEWQSIEQNSEPLKTFFDYWTIKESAIKHDGRGVEFYRKQKFKHQKFIAILLNYFISN